MMQTLRYRAGAMLLLPVVCSLLLAGCGGQGHVLGVPPSGSAVTVADAAKTAPGTPVVLRGKMVER